MDKYKGLKVGQIVTLNVSGTHDLKHKDAGTQFKIAALPAKTSSRNGNLYFVFGHTISTGDIIRAEVNEIIK